MHVAARLQQPAHDRRPPAAMGIVDTTRRWLRRNRTAVAVTAGVVGVGYVAAQYVVSRLRDARERANDDRIARENLRRRFQQNQEDCSLTVLALLPAATAAIVDAMDTDKITDEIHRLRARRGSASTSVAGSAVTGLHPDEDGRSPGSSIEQGDSSMLASQSSLVSVGENAGVEPGRATAAKPDATDPPEPSRPRQTKRQLWDQLAITSITRAFTLIYTLALLTMFTRVQLNLLGRRSYLSSVVWLATGCPPGNAAITMENKDDVDEEFLASAGTGASQSQSHSTRHGREDFETNRRYLAFSWWFLNRGWPAVRVRVEAAVRAVFGHLSPRDTLTLDAFATLTARVRDLVERPAASPPSPWLSSLLPPVEHEAWLLRQSGILEDDLPDAAQAAPPLRHLLDETADLVESAAFTHVLDRLLDSAFSLLINHKLAALAFDQPLPLSLPTAVSSPAPRAGQSVLLPRVLSVLTRQAHVIGGPGPNEYLTEMERVRDLDAFAAVVYSSNWENETRSPPYAPGPQSASATAPAAAASSPSPAEKSAPVDVVLPASANTQDKFVAADGVGESVVLVDPQASFEGAWGRAVDTKKA